MWEANSEQYPSSPSAEDRFEYSEVQPQDDDEEEAFVYPGASEEPQQASGSATVNNAVNNAAPTPAQLESLYAASSSGDLLMLKKLFANAAHTSDVQHFSLANEASTRTGLTSLHVAASKGYLDIVTWLVDECGALPNLEDREGETALHKASLNGNLPVLQYFLPNRADVHVKDADGWTALHNAASKGYLDIVRFLCEVGGASETLQDGTPGVDVKNKSGWTPLMNAASKGHLPVVRYLLTKQKANPLVRNNWGETAYDVSASVFEIYICDLLQQAEMTIFHTQGQPDSYDPLAVHTTVPLILYENQRLDSRLKTLATNGGRPRFSATGLRTASVPGNGRHAFELRVPGTKDKVVGAWRSDVQLPLLDDPFKLPQPGKPSSGMEGRERSCFWLSDWTLDTTHPSYDPNSGWAYCPSFSIPESEWTPVLPSLPSSSPSTSTSHPPQKYMRRRRWVRLLRRRLDIPPFPFLQPDGKYCLLTSDGGLVSPDVSLGDTEHAAPNMASEDYISFARRLVGQNDSNNNTISDPGEARRSVLKLERAVEGLRSGITSDQDCERKTQAEVLLHAYTRELARQKADAAARGLIISGNDDDLFNRSLPTSSSDDDEEFHYPGAGPSSPSPWTNSPRQSSSLSGSISSDFPRSLSRTTTSSSCLAPDLTPQLSHAPEFRVPTHEAPPTSSSSSHAGSSGIQRATWEKDTAIATCRDCQRRFTFILRRHHCRRCGKIYCDKCSSFRAVLDPSELVKDPSAANTEFDDILNSGSRTVNSRVCRSCFVEVSGGRDDDTITGSQGIGGMLERIVVDRGRLYPRGNSSGMGRGRSSSQLSDLAECPVCNVLLENLGSVAQQEVHVKKCLEGGARHTPGSLQGTKYLVYALPAESALIGVECVICLEEFVKGSSVARLSCFCSFHSSCLTSWLQRGKACPVHSR